MQNDKKPEVFINNQFRVSFKNIDKETINKLNKIFENTGKSIGNINENIPVIEIDGDKVWIPVGAMIFLTNKEKEQFKEIVNSCICTDKNLDAKKLNSYMFNESLDIDNFLENIFVHFNKIKQIVFITSDKEGTSAINIHLIRAILSLTLNSDEKIKGLNSDSVKRNYIEGIDGDNFYEKYSKRIKDICGLLSEEIKGLKSEKEVKKINLEKEDPFDLNSFKKLEK